MSSDAETTPTKVAPAVHWTVYGVALSLIAVVYVLYGVNIVRWQNSPDFGWRTMYDSGPNVVAEVFDRGSSAGLRQGDFVEAINGQRYTTFDELFFHGLRHGEAGSTNTYTVVRYGARSAVTVTTGRLGLRAVIWRSAPMLLIGLFFVCVGALVFLMKPRARESWVFFAMTSVVGMFLSYAAPADLLRPTWLYDLRFLFEVTLPATMIHLALTFPKAHPALEKRPWLAVVPYAPSAAMFAALVLTTNAYWEIPRPLYLMYLVYTLVGVMVFLGLTAWNALRDASIIVRLQGRVILVGILVGFLVPTIDLLARFAWHAHLFPDPALSFAVFLGLFPVSIGYTIVKHDLFAIDVIVRRTYGYVLSTAFIVGAYAVLVSTLNVGFQSTDVSRSPLFSIAFALGVVLLFGPVHRRFQRLVDRMFYRQQYDYRQTLKSMSEALTSIFDEQVIVTTLVESVTREMFLESATVLRPSADGAQYTPRASDSPRQIGTLDTSNPLLRLIGAKGDVIARFEIQMNPAYEEQRAAYLATFQALSAELVVPMRYKDGMVGIIALGQKKSGKLFTAEDLDLLRTLANQSAVALENARLFQEYLVKSRIEDELNLARDIQSSMLPAGPPEVPGFAIAARSTSAREVGGDFYDFIPFASAGGSERLGIVVADVVGKGVSGALLMAAARSTYRVLLDSQPSVTDVMNLANRRLHRDIRKGTFVAVLYAMLDPDSRTLTFSNAGQTQPVLSQKGADAMYLDCEGDCFPLGIVPDCTYRESTVKLTRDDVLVFYTDGVVEAMNEQGMLYGFERLLKTVTESRERDAEALLNALLQDIAQHVGTMEAHDDVTLVVVKAT